MAFSLFRTNLSGQEEIQLIFSLKRSTMKVVHVEAHQNERSFEIQLADGYFLVFKLFGHISNLILYQNDQVVSLFKNHQKKDLTVSRSGFNRSIDQSREAFTQAENPIKELYPTFGKLTKAYFEAGLSQ